jgi:hypothetical protein
VTAPLDTISLSPAQARVLELLARLSMEYPALAKTRGFTPLHILQRIDLQEGDRDLPTPDGWRRAGRSYASLLGRLRAAGLVEPLLTKQVAMYTPASGWAARTHWRLTAHGQAYVGVNT